MDHVTTIWLICSTHIPPLSTQVKNTFIEVSDSDASDAEAEFQDGPWAKLGAFHMRPWFLDRLDVF